MILVQLLDNHRRTVWYLLSEVELEGMNEVEYEFQVSVCLLGHGHRKAVHCNLLHSYHKNKISRDDGRIRLNADCSDYLITALGSESSRPAGRRTEPVIVMPRPAST